MSAGVDLPPGDSECDRAMPVYRAGPAPARANRLELAPSGGGALLYLAVRHTDNPADPRLGSLEREIRGFRPTVIFYEGDARGVGDGRRDTVRRWGEAGFLRLLGAELGVPARSFDVTATAQIDFLAEHFDAVEVKLYFVLREIWLLRERQGRSVNEIRRLARAIITGERLPQLPGVLLTEADFVREFGRRWPPGTSWTEPRAAWFDPYRASRSSGGVFTNDLERAVTVFRDTFMYRTLAEEVRRGERVFAAAGSGHLPVQGPALTCALGR